MISNLVRKGKISEVFRQYWNKFMGYYLTVNHCQLFVVFLALFAGLHPPLLVTCKQWRLKRMTVNEAMIFTLLYKLHLEHSIPPPGSWTSATHCLDIVSKCPGWQRLIRRFAFNVLTILPHCCLHLSQCCGIDPCSLTLAGSADSVQGLLDECCLVCSYLSHLTGSLRTIPRPLVI